MVAAGLLVVLPLIIALGLAVWALASSPLQSARPAQPLLASVERAERRDRLSATIRLVKAQAFPVISQSTGTVTSVSISPGTAVESGQTVLTVDGRAVVAYVASSPLYRDIGQGARGADVEVAEQFLVGLGHLDKADAVADASTAAAIRAFNASNGLPHDATLSLSSLVWIPAGSAPPVSLTVRLGQQLTPQSELYTTVSGQDLVQVDSPVSESERLLTVGSATVPLPAGSNVIKAPGDVAALKDALGGEDTTRGSLEPVAARAVGTVPATAVIVDDQGRACFFSGVQGQGRPIDAGTGSFGLVDVDAALIGEPVLVNPRETRQDLACGS